ncbi:MAG: hypothetical protein AB1742_06685 [bacterium]
MTRARREPKPAMKNKREKGKRTAFPSAAALAVFLLLPSLCPAQYGRYNHPELRWHTLKTAHFRVHYHEPLGEVAKKTAAVAEMAFKPLSELYRYNFSKDIHIVVTDYDDESNGAAYYQTRRIVINARRFDSFFVFRGGHEWIPNVVTHELSHIISLEAARQNIRIFHGLEIRAFEKQWDAALYIPRAFVPPWFAEGLAQYQAPELGFDTWDTHRDMLLRTAALDDRLLSYDAMCTFGKDSLGNEMVYNQGFSMVRRLAGQHGADAPGRVALEVGKSPAAFNRAWRAVAGTSPREFHRRWRDSVRDDYVSRTAAVRANLQEGTALGDTGVFELFPAWSPDGASFAYLTDGGTLSSHYLDLYVRRVRGGAGKISRYVVSPPSWSPDGRYLVYSKYFRPDDHGSHYLDLYVADVKEGGETRLTYGLRAADPAWSPDGEWILFVQGSAEDVELAVIRPDGTGFRTITEFEPEWQAFTPRWSPDGKKIVVALQRPDARGRRLAVLEFADGAKPDFLDVQGDSRDPAFSSDGRAIYYACDKSGIFNIYRRDAASGEEQLLTNTVGGAFMPSAAPSGELLFSLYGENGFDLALIESPAPLDTASAAYTLPPENAPAAVDKNSIKEQPKKYGRQKTGTFIAPALIHTPSQLYAGVSISNEEVINRYSYSFSVLIGEKRRASYTWRYDLRRFKPSFYVTGSHGFRKSEFSVDYVGYSAARRTEYLELGAVYPFNDFYTIGADFYVSKYTYSSLHAAVPVTDYRSNSAGYDFMLRYSRMDPRFDSDVNPSDGRSLSLTYGQEEINDSFTGYPDERTDVTTYLARWTEYVDVSTRRRRTLVLSLQGGALDQTTNYYYFDAGSMSRLRGYPPGERTGNVFLVGSATFRFPVLENIDRKIINVYFQRLYLGVFYDYGDAWQYRVPGSRDFASDAGVEFRLKGYTFYTTPTNFTWTLARPLDREEGNDWRNYLSVSFSF